MHTTQQNVSHSNTNSAIGFDKSILFLFPQIVSDIHLSRKFVYTVFLPVFLFFYFLFYKSFLYAIHLASQVSFYAVGRGCKNNICNSLVNHYKTVISPALYIIPNRVSFIRIIPICLKTHCIHVQYRCFVIGVENCVRNSVNGFLFLLLFIFICLKWILVNYDIRFISVVYCF